MADISILQPLDLYFNTHMSTIHINGLQDNSNSLRILLEILFLSRSLQPVIPLLEEKLHSTTDDHSRNLLEVIHNFVTGLQRYVPAIPERIHDLVSDFVGLCLCDYN